MHPKIQERRGAVLSEHLDQVDRDIKSVCTSIARRILLAGSLCVGEDEAKILENQFNISVDYVIRTQASSEEGRRSRRELITKLIELDDYLDSLLRTPWARSELIARCRQNLDRCRQNLDRIKESWP